MIANTISLKQMQEANVQSEAMDHIEAFTREMHPEFRECYWVGREAYRRGPQYLEKQSNSGFPYSVQQTVNHRGTSYDYNRHTTFFDIGGETATDFGFASVITSDCQCHVEAFGENPDVVSSARFGPAAGRPRDPCRYIEEALFDHERPETGVPDIKELRFVWKSDPGAMTETG